MLFKRIIAEVYVSGVNSIKALAYFVLFLSVTTSISLALARKFKRVHPRVLCGSPKRLSD